ncbi:putative kinase HI_0665 isoform X1 [Hydra vulgaris]|uniref:putative kinase HI_0665 isoform X1 n=1 Tax=Hydra vulgaris TaxID=6087 RepID=UPI001F5F3FD6|nr:putative kinase HI_0665 [Hydra vulgaris]
MAQETLRVYYNNKYAGKLIKDQLNSSSFQYSFQYDIDYINNNNATLSFNLPLCKDKFESRPNLFSYFENLISEGWLRDMQYEALKQVGIKDVDKFSILCFFGHDLLGSVSIKSEKPMQKRPYFNYSINNEQLYLGVPQGTTVNIESTATIPGVQKKLLVKKNYSGLFEVTCANELSTHIAKMEVNKFPDLIELEYLSSLAVKHILPDDVVCGLEISNIDNFNEKALIIERFDRSVESNYTSSSINNENIKRRHFEEFNQLLNLSSENKYESSYDEMAVFIHQNIKLNRCNLNELLKLFRRILAFILIGNTDAHLKNFAMFHEPEGSLCLTPMYDVVASAYYERFKEMALKLNYKKAELSKLKPKDIVDFAFKPKGFNLSKEYLLDVVEQLRDNKLNAIRAIQQNDCVSEHSHVKEKLIKMIEKRWNGTFHGIDIYLKKIKK